MVKSKARMPFNLLKMWSAIIGFAIKEDKTFKRHKKMVNLKAWYCSKSVNFLSANIDCAMHIYHLQCSSFFPCIIDAKCLTWSILQQHFNILHEIVPISEPSLNWKITNQHWFLTFNRTSWWPRKVFCSIRKKDFVARPQKKGFPTSAEKVMRRGAKQSFADGPKVKRGSKLCTSCCWHWTMAVSNSFDQAGRHSRQKTR